MRGKLVILLVMVVTSTALAQREDSNDCGSTTIQCTCGIGPTKTALSLELKMYAIQDPVTNMTKCSGYPDPYQACANHSCTLAPNSTYPKTKPGLESSGKEKEDLIASFFAKEFILAPGSEGHRLTRQSDPCHVTPLKNAEIKCWKWPNWINCDITCIHGYALQLSKGSVTTTNVNCRLTENQWKPQAFQDCQPFVNCKAHLVKPGDLKCKEPINSPAYCEISCLDYDQYEATPLQKYECLDETFARTLPHCAVLSPNVQLVRKPN